MRAYVPIIVDDWNARPDAEDAIEVAASVRDSLVDLGFRSDVVGVGLDLSRLETLAGEQPRAVFNLVESIRGDGRLGFLASAALDHLDTPYTGAPTGAYLQSSSKLLTKHLLASAGLPAPAWWTGNAPADRKVIVKSVWEHASIGIDQNSVVDGARATEEIARREARYGGQFFAEAYIPGREFNISIIESETGPVVLPLAEMIFDDLPEGVLPIIDYAAKWDQEAASYSLLRRGFDVEDSEPGLARRLRRLSLECWRAAGLRGYARIDLRVDDDGEIFILEFNANPCLARDAGFCAAAAKSGRSYQDAIAEIVAAAVKTGSRPCSASAS